MPVERRQPNRLREMIEAHLGRPISDEQLDLAADALEMMLLADRDFCAQVRAAARGSK